MVYLHHPIIICLLALFMVIPFSITISTIDIPSDKHKSIDNDLSEEPKDTDRNDTSPDSIELDNVDEVIEEEPSGPRPCSCGIFLSTQFKKGSKDQPKGEPVIMQEMDNHFAHNAIGARQCVNKCIEMIIKHLPKSAAIICATIDYDCVKEKAYLFTRNFDDLWSNTNMSAGREFCCKDNLPYKCPK